MQTPKQSNGKSVKLTVIYEDGAKSKSFHSTFEDALRSLKHARRFGDKIKQQIFSIRH